jgi:hypothetical protein
VIDGFSTQVLVLILDLDPLKRIFLLKMGKMVFLKTGLIKKNIEFKKKGLKPDQFSSILFSK